MNTRSRYNNGYDSVAKILVLGDSGVGKTCLILKFCEDNFISQYYTTIGIDFRIKTIELENKKVKLQIWDTACQDRFTSVTKSYYSGAMAIVFAYSCNDRDSFKNLENWIVQAKKLAVQKVCTFLVATKSDVVARTVSYDEGEKLASLYGMEFFETSAKEGTNVSELFTSITKEVLNTDLIEKIDRHLSETRLSESRRYIETEKKKKPPQLLPDWFTRICCAG